MEPNLHQSAKRVIFVHDTQEFGGIELFMLLLIKYYDHDRYLPIVMVPGFSDEHRSSPQEFIDQVTPFLNNAATVLVMAPIAASFASSLGYSPDPFLMAVAIGAACDFLTPIGHQSNLLVMGPGGYSFGDYWRLGLPLSILVVVAGVLLIALFWPFRPI